MKIRVIASFASRVFSEDGLGENNPNYSFITRKIPPKPRLSLAIGLVCGSKERPAYFQPAL